MPLVLSSVGWLGMDRQIGCWLGQVFWDGGSGCKKNLKSVCYKCNLLPSSLGLLHLDPPDFILLHQWWATCVWERVTFTGLIMSMIGRNGRGNNKKTNSYNLSNLLYGIQQFYWKYRHHFLATKMLLLGKFKKYQQRLIFLNFLHPFALHRAHSYTLLYFFFKTTLTRRYYHPYFSISKWNSERGSKSWKVT